jgi:3-deoxy-D-arabino-heptulosonate 7-phosphate (DAHP) synthase
MDLSAIPAIKRLSHLPIVADPSHGTGKWYLVEPMALAALGAGAIGGLGAVVGGRIAPARERRDAPPHPA